MKYVIDLNEKLINEFKKETRGNDVKILENLINEYLEDLKDSKKLDKAIRESDGKFYSSEEFWDLVGV